jgi:hypothetical protein
MSVGDVEDGRCVASAEKAFEVEERWRFNRERGAELFGISKVIEDLLCTAGLISKYERREGCCVIGRAGWRLEVRCGSWMEMGMEDGDCRLEVREVGLKYQDSGK